MPISTNCPHQAYCEMREQSDMRFISHLTRNTFAIILAGGRGTMFGTFIGVLILGVLNNGMNMLNIDPFFSEALRGIVIIIAVLIDTLRKRGEVGVCQIQ